MDLFVQATSLYTNCSFDYYLQSIAKGTTSVSGGINLVVNIVYRSFYDTTVYGNLASAMSAKNNKLVGTYVGQWFRSLMM